MDASKKHSVTHRGFRLRRSTLILVTIGAVVFLLALLVAPFAWSVGRAAVDIRNAQTSLEQAKTHLEAYDLITASRDVRQAKTSLDSARDRLHALGWWRDLPALGTQIRAVEDASAAAGQTLESVDTVLRAMNAVVDAVRLNDETKTDVLHTLPSFKHFSDLSNEERRDLMARLSNTLPAWRLARDTMHLARELWARVPDKELAGPLRTALQPLARTIPTLEESLTEFVPLIDALIPLSGYPTPRRYLVVLQNADELRPSGGFVGTIGTMRFDAGARTESSFTDVYSIDNPVSGVWKDVPPDPIVRYLGLRQWFLRDANWSPDFPTSAEQMLSTYERERSMQEGKPIADPPSGVIAFEPGFFEDLLRLTGPMTVDGLTFTAENFFDQLEYDVEMAFKNKGIPSAQRKDIVVHLGEAIIDRLSKFPPERWPEILRLMTQALERKQIMTYVRDPGLLSIVDQHGWTGRVRPATGDALWVVDANLAALKTDGAMQKAVRYQVDARDPEHLMATVTLTYTNTTRTIDWRHTRYRSYTRIYAPEGSVLRSSSGAMKDDLNKTGGRFIPGTVDVFRDLGRTVFGTFWAIEPGKTGTLSFTYELPSSVRGISSENPYTLLWQKQPGADNTRLTVDLLFGKNIRSASPPEDPKAWGDARYGYTTDSLIDRTFEVKF